MKKVVNLFIFGIIFLFGCSNSQSDGERKIDYQKRVDAIPRIVDSITYQKDSQQIINSVRWGFDNDGYFFNDFKRLGFEKSKYVSIYVDRIFYNKDSSKLFAIVIMKEPIQYQQNPNLKHFEDADFAYSGITIVSSRKQDGKWILIPVSWYRISEAISSGNVKYMFYYFLLDNMLTKKLFDFYQCTIEQDCFWSEKNGYWRMGEIIPGYYNYEVKPNRDYFKATGIKVDSSNVKDYIFKPLQEY